MKKASKVLAYVFLLTFAIMLPACCTNTQVPQHPSLVIESGNNVRNPDAGLIAHLKDSTVALVERDIDPKSDSFGHYRATCAGVWINLRQIVTAYHCVAPESDLPPPLNLLIKPEIPIGKTFEYKTFEDWKASEDYQEFESAREATLVAADPNNDVALLTIKGAAPGHDWALFGTESPTDGAVTHIVGHPTGEVYTYMRGVISATRVKENVAGNKKALLYQISAPIWFGNSGGGAFDEQGNLIGIASFIKVRVPNMSFFVHRDIIVSFLAKERAVQ